MARFDQGRKKKLNINRILEEILSCRTTSDSSEVTFQGRKFFESEAALCSVLDINPEIQGIHREGIKIEGIRKACKQDNVNEATILAAVKDAEASHLRIPKERMTVLGNISIDQRLSVAQRRFRERRLQIAFPADRPTKFEHHRSEQEFFDGRPASTFGRYFRASVWARTPEGGVTRAINQLDTLRALWNISLIRNQKRYFNYRREPLNTIVIGPTYTVYKPSGKLLEKERLWFEPGHCYEAKNLYDPHRKWPAAEIYGRQKRQELARLPDEYRKRMELALRRFARALDGTLWDTVVHRLWSILELLTGKAQNETYDSVVKRVSGYYIDSGYNEQVLQHLRLHRNDIIHNDTASQGNLEHVFLLKRYTIDLIEFHIREGSRFGTFDQACEFLGLSNDESNLRSSIEAHEKRLALRRELLRRVMKKNNAKEMTE